MKSKGSRSIYFPGLNGIRAIAALLVVCSHISLSLEIFGFSDYGGIDMAGYGVTMFIVLSGYLITYLLLNEYEENKLIDYRKFYMRRILRIWPIYYLSIIIALTCIYFGGHAIDGTGLFFYLFMMANVPFVFGGALNLVGQLWSVGVEEQFYLFWPWLFKKTKSSL
jgi:peptidoglycan/LPS O-acetylase OafA/YrhL